MNREIRLAKSHLYVGLICLPVVVAAMIGSVVFFLGMPARMLGIGLAAFTGLFWGTGAVLCVWSLLSDWKGWLRIEGERITKQGVWLKREFDLTEVNEVRWIAHRRGAIVLRAAGLFLKLDLESYERDDRLWLIRYLRGGIPRQVEQADWDLFCHQVAVPLRDRGCRTAPKADEILVTRRRFDWLTGIGLIAMAIVIGAARQAGLPLSWWALLLMPVIWLVRFDIPQQGKLVRRAPGFAFLYALLLPAATLSVMAARAFNWNPKWFLLTVVCPLGIAMLISMYRFMRKHVEQQRRDSGASVALWEQGES